MNYFEPRMWTQEEIDLTVKPLLTRIETLEKELEQARQSQVKSHNLLMDMIHNLSMNTGG